MLADEKHPRVPVYHYLLTFQLVWILARWSQEWRNWCDRKKLMDLIGSSDSHPCNVFYIFPWMYHIHPDTWSVIKCFAPPNHTRPVQAGSLAAGVFQLLPEKDWQDMAKHLAGWSSNSRSKKLQCHFITVFAELWPFCQLCLINPWGYHSKITGISGPLLHRTSRELLRSAALIGWWRQGFFLALSVQQRLLESPRLLRVRGSGFATKWSPTKMVVLPSKMEGLTV